MDVSLAHIVVPMLRHYRQNITGCPSDLYPNDHIQLSFDFIDTDAEHELAEARWMKLLDEMIWAFERYANGELIGGSSADSQRAKEGLAAFARYYGALWS